MSGAGFEVLLFDNRGVGKSGPCVLEHQTAQLLAHDAEALIDHVWGRDAPVHVFG